jgi:hypothetical protein
MAADSLIERREWRRLLRRFRDGYRVGMDKDAVAAYHAGEAPAEGASMPRKSRKETDTAALSVRPPRSVAPAIGDIKSVELALSVRRDATMLTVGAVEVAGMLSAAEWEVVARALRGRTVEPEVTSPGAQLADHVRIAHAAYGVGRRDAEPKKEAPSLADRLAALSYPQAWALIVAVRFRWAHEAQLAPGEEWWQLSVRAKHLLPEDYEEEQPG